MKSGRFVYTCAVVVALVIALGVWRPLHVKADHDNGGTPQFRVDPYWPKPLPAPVGYNLFTWPTPTPGDDRAHPWVQGEVAGSCTDAEGNVYTFNRGWEAGVVVNGVLQGNQSGAVVGQDASDFTSPNFGTGRAMPSPPVVVFNPEGKVIAAWGNPALYHTTTAAMNQYAGAPTVLPHGAHGCFVDYQGNVWLGGNGDGVIQKYNPHVAATQGAAATPILQIGTHGLCDGSPAANPAAVNPTCNETNSNNTSHHLLNEPPDMAVDPDTNEVFVADGYGNHRIVVFDASTGAYKRQWGRDCGMNSIDCPAGYFGHSGGGHPHCVVLGNDNLVYVCDRANSRIQVFKRNCGAASVEGSGDINQAQPLCQPERIIRIENFPSAPSAVRSVILAAGTRACDMDFWPNLDTLANNSPKRQKLIVDVDLGNDNTWIIDKASGITLGALGRCGVKPCPGHNVGEFAFGHTTNVDPDGNIYVAETITGRRIQKFVRTDEADDDHDRGHGDH